MIVRLGVSSDLERVRPLLRSLIEESKSEITWSPSTSAFFNRALLDCIEGVEGGVAVAVERDVVGFSLARRAELPFTTKFGRIAFGWGTWVHPELRGEGVSSRLRGVLFSHLRAIGIRTLIGGVALGNEAALESAKASGFEPYSIYGALTLESE